MVGSSQAKDYNQGVKLLLLLGNFGYFLVVMPHFQPTPICPVWKPQTGPLGRYDILQHGPWTKRFVGTFKQLWVCLLTFPACWKESWLAHQACAAGEQFRTARLSWLELFKDLGGFLGSSNSGHRMDSFSILCAPWVLTSVAAEWLLLPFPDLERGVPPWMPWSSSAWLAWWEDSGAKRKCHIYMQFRGMTLLQLVLLNIWKIDTNKTVKRFH